MPAQPSSKQTPAKQRRRADVHKIVDDLLPLARPIESLVPDPANARHHPDRSIETLKVLLQKYGQRKPLVVRRDGMVAEAGNGLLTAARALGWTHVAAVLVDDDEKTAAEYGLADNRSAELSVWDPVALPKAMLVAGEFEALGWSADEAKLVLGEVKLPELEDGIVESGSGRSSGGGQDTLAATAARIRVGSYKFDVPRSEYDAWVEGIHKASGFDKADIVAEIRRRLGL